MLFYLGFGLVLSVPVFFLSPYIVHAFKMAPGAQPHAIFVFRVFFGLVVASMILQLPGTAVVAKHRMDLASRNNFAGYIAYAVLVAVLLYMHLGIRALMIAQAAQIAVTATMHYLTARRLFGPVFADPRHLNGTVVKRMFRFGGWTQLTSLLNVVTIDAGRFLSASIINIGAVTFYEVGGKLAFISRTLPNYLVSAVSPAAAAADAHANDDAVRRIEWIASLYLMLATTLLAGFIVGACGPIMRVWLGSEFPHVAAITLWLAIGYVVSSGATVGTVVLRSVGRPELETLCVGVGAVLNVGATLVLARFYGVAGVAMGTCVGWLGFTICYSIVERRRRGAQTAHTSIVPALRIAGVGATCTLGLMLLVRTEVMRSLFTAKLTGLIGLGLCGVAYVVAFAVLAWAAGACRFDEERIVRSAMRLRRYSATRLRRVGAS
jgi:O-antigen/teichoic acid export membrane protein